MNKESIMPAPGGEPNQLAKSPWKLAIGSIIASIVTFVLHVAYGHVHWNILARNYQNMAVADREKYLFILRQLEFHRLFGLLAVILAIVAITRRPRWPAFIYGPLAVLAGMVALVIM
jgi:hypothetical protein